MHKQIEDAIKKSVKKYNQAPDLAKKITMWMDELSLGNELKEDGSRALQRAGMLYDATVATDTEG